MNDILADYREWRDQQADRVSTHSDGCHMWHEQCMIHRLADAMERARLTDAEREAIGVAVVDMAKAITVNTPVPVANGIRRRAAELWELLERTK
jgi:hypothetical protein